MRSEATYDIETNRVSVTISMPLAQVKTLTVDQMIEKAGRLSRSHFRSFKRIANRSLNIRTTPKDTASALPFQGEVKVVPVDKIPVFLTPPRIDNAFLASLDHVHLESGECIKNRFGPRCQS
jgi:hypothetical protein